MCAGAPSGAGKLICLWQMCAWAPSDVGKHICLWQMCAGAPLGAVFILLLKYFYKVRLFGFDRI